MSQLDLSHQFLIAMPSMVDSAFHKALIYICEHNEHGALGLVVNRPISLALGNLFEQIRIPLSQPEIKNIPVHFGGPVQTDRGFVLHDPIGNWQSTLTINNKIGLTTSKDILEAVAEGRGPRNLLVTLGYAGWEPGQLEHELTQNAWLNTEASEHIMFELPAEERFYAAMSLMGVDYATLSDEVGHA